jgi:hypothetical protein
MQNYNLYWYGNLTTENAEQVGKLFTQLLGDGKDGKYHTAIAALPQAFDKGDADCSVDVHPSLRLYEKDGVKVSVEDGRAHLTIHNTYGLWMLDTDIPNGRDVSGRTPYISFGGNKVTIKHRAPAGNLLVWTFAVEDHAE